MQLNRYVAGATTPLLKSLAKQLGISEGEVIDRAVQTLAICESFGPESVRQEENPQITKRDSRLARNEETRQFNRQKLAENAKRERPPMVTQVMSPTAPRSRFLKRRTE